MTSLRNLLEPAEAPFAVDLRSEPEQLTVAIRATIERHEIASWWTGAFAEIYTTLRAQDTEPSGPGGGLYSTELFADDRGDATIFVPVHETPPDAGRVHRYTVPAAELAVVTHAGTDENIDLAYGALGRCVSERALGVDGPVHENYTVAAINTPTRHSGAPSTRGPSSGLLPEATRVRRSDRVGVSLDELDLVAVGVGEERDRDRPAVG